MKIKINRSIFKITAVLIAVAVIALLLFYFLKRWENDYGEVETSAEEAADDERIYLDEKCYVPNKNLETVLLIGVDKDEAQTENMAEDGYNNNQQADFLMLLVVDKEAETYSALHINRDTMAEIPVLGVRGEDAGTITGQLALAHTYGSGGQDSCRNTAKAVSDLLYGIRIDHFVSFTMDAVNSINDCAGGVKVTVLDDFSSFYPEMQEGETVKLDGDMALAYVRTRSGLDDSSNVRRMERQRQYMESLKTTLMDKASAEEDFPARVMKAVSPYMVSDCTANQLSRLFEEMKLFTEDGIQTIEGEATEGEEFMEFYPDEDALKKQIVELFYVPLEK